MGSHVLIRLSFLPSACCPTTGRSRAAPSAITRGLRPTQTLVIACCDPAVGLIAQELAREGDVRLIVLPRSSHAALDLLGKGLVHAAGVHLARADEPEGNLAAVRDCFRAGSDHRLLRVADWDEGIALAPGLGLRTVEAVIRARLRWVCREAGSGAQQCLHEVLGAETKRQLPRNSRLASDHRGVADAIRNGWADAGVCLRLTEPGSQPRFPEHQAGGLRPLLPCRAGRRSSRPVPRPDHPLLRLSPAARRTPGLRYDADGGHPADRPMRRGFADPSPVGRSAAQRRMRGPDGRRKQP